MPLSVLTDAEQGSRWPRLVTLTTVSETVGLQLTADGNADVVAALLQLVDRERYLSLRDLAITAGLRPNTLYDLRTSTASPTMSTRAGRRELSWGAGLGRASPGAVCA